MNHRRVAYGALAVAGAILVYRWFELGDPKVAIVSLILLVLAVILVGAVGAFLVSIGRTWLRKLRGISPEDHLRDLERQGIAVREHYTTKRVLTFEELNTSSLIHIIETGDNRLLCLYDQDYFSFEPHDDDPEISQPRLFPTTEFHLLRHVRKNKVLALFPGSDVVEPIVCNAIAGPMIVQQLGMTVADGEIVSDLPFDAVQDAIQNARV